MKTHKTEVPIHKRHSRSAIDAGRFLLAGSGTSRYILVAFLALSATVFYVGITAFSGEPGLPLDDGWIHQTYARNLIELRSWSYFGGEVSAGSTSPLWTLLLSLGYLLRLPPLFWVYLLGWLCLTWIGWSGMKLWAGMWPTRAQFSWAIGVVIVLSWPLVWAAGSGMETLLFCGLAMQLIVSYNRQQESGTWQSWSLGLLAGLLILTRPDGLSLALLVAVGIFLSSRTVKDKVLRVSTYLLVATALLIPYFLLNYYANNSIWPNTFYAKQNEYSFLWDNHIIQRYFKLLYYTLGGPAEGLRGISAAHLLLLPGVLVAGWRSLQTDWSFRRLYCSLPLIWAAGHIFLYAWRLPVTYQHGRYLMPVIPVIMLYGIAGWSHLFDWLKDRFEINEGKEFVLKTVGKFSFATLLIFFLILGSQAFRDDIAFINGEMVSTARWLKVNTPEEAIIAAHDIGAIGYFANRHILDLAGLISPDVIPLLANEEGMASYVLQSEAEYLVTAPGWPYKSLTTLDQVNLLFSTDYAWTKMQGSNNMAVYKLGR